MSNPPKKLNYRVAVGWGIGGGSLSAVDFAKVLLLGYLVDYVGVSAIVAGSMIGLCKLYDALIDPLVGAVSDRTKSSWGRRRPYLLAGALACGFSYFLMFHVPQFKTPAFTLTFVFVSLIIYATAYALFSVPYKAMSAEITDDYHARSTLMSIGTVFFSIGTMVGTSTAPTLIALFGGGRNGHEAMSSIMGIGTCGVGLICFLMTTGAHSRPPTAIIAGPKRREIWSLLFKNKPFFILTLSSVMRGIAIAFMNGAAVFYTRRVLKVGDAWLGQFFLVLTGSIILSLPAWIWISRRLGKKNAFLLGILLIAPASLSWLWASAAEPIWVFLLRTILIGFGSGSLIGMGQSMLPDTIEFDRIQSGLNREGIFAGFTTTVEKATVALGIAAVGLVLGLTGYVQSPTPGVVQPQSAVVGIYICFAVMPALFLALSGLIMLFYPITEASLKKMRTSEIEVRAIGALAP